MLFIGTDHTLPSSANSFQLVLFFGTPCDRRVGFAFLCDSARHVGHLEQHPGAQEAAGLSAGEAAAAAERPGAAVRLG